MTDLAVTIDGVRYVRDDMPKRFMAERDALKSELATTRQKLWVAEQELKGTEDANVDVHTAWEATKAEFDALKTERDEWEQRATDSVVEAGNLRAAVGQQANAYLRLHEGLVEASRGLTEARVFAAQQRSDMEATISEQSHQLTAASADAAHHYQAALQLTAQLTQLRAAAERVRRSDYSDTFGAFKVSRDVMALLDAALSAVGTETMAPKRCDPREVRTPDEITAELWAGLVNDGLTSDAYVACERAAAIIASERDATRAYLESIGAIGEDLPRPASTETAALKANIERMAANYAALAVMNAGFQGQLRRLRSEVRRADSE